MISAAAARSATSAALVEAAAAGNAIAWDEIVRRYAGLVWSVARAHRLGAADAADVSQTVWLRLVEHLGGLRDPEAVPGWLRATARHECLRVIRRGARESTRSAFEPDEAPTATASPEHLLLDDERDRHLWAALAQLSERCRNLLRVLAYAPDAGYADISRTLGLPVGSIGPSRARCLAHLKRRLEQTGYLAAGTDAGGGTK